ncbi:MAG: transposase [Thermodesulfovibrionia bacterium]|nr:transposase [Thermodesulfovibrionia bacterium]
MIKPIFTNDGLYHIYNRGVEKRDVFMDDGDYLRFVHNLYEFNDESPVSNFNYHFDKQTKTVRSTHFTVKKEPRKLLVDILVFTLMPNHFHLLLRQRKEKGISKFMQKTGIAYTNYFNKKYERVGPLFQGKFKAVHVNEEPHFIHLPHYIHMNSLQLNYGNRIPIDFLSGYRWSSFPDYIGRKNFPSVTSRGFLLDIFGGEDGYLRYTEERLGYKENENILEQVDGVALD